MEAGNKGRAGFDGSMDSPPSNISANSYLGGMRADGLPPLALPPVDSHNERATFSDDGFITDLT